MDGGQDTEVLDGFAHLEIAGAPTWLHSPNIHYAAASRGATALKTLPEIRTVCLRNSIRDDRPDRHDAAPPFCISACHRASTRTQTPMLIKCLRALVKSLREFAA
jgi:hypothetical protein